jgi:hypothetical protein
MSYPIGTPVHSVLLDGRADDDVNVVGTIVLVVMAGTGEVYTRQVDYYRDAQRECATLEAHGCRVLAVVEGETDLSTGEASVWAKR